MCSFNPELKIKQRESKSLSKKSFNCGPCFQIRKLHALANKSRQNNDKSPDLTKSFEWTQKTNTDLEQTEILKPVIEQSQIEVNELKNK